MCFKALCMLSEDVSSDQPFMLAITKLTSVPLALLYAPCMSFLSEWFVEKRGLAIGVIFAGRHALSQIHRFY